MEDFRMDSKFICVYFFLSRLECVRFPKMNAKFANWNWNVNWEMSVSTGEASQVKSYLAFQLDSTS